MIVRNTTQRNIRLLAGYQYMTDPDTGEAVKAQTGRPVISGAPFKVLIPAGASLELSDAEWTKVAKAAEPLLKLEYLVFKSRPTSPLTIQQIINRTSRNASVDLKYSLGKEKLSLKATDLKVDILTPYTDEEVEKDAAKEAHKERTKPKAKSEPVSESTKD